MKYGIVRVGWLIWLCFVPLLTMAQDAFPQPAHIFEHDRCDDAGNCNGFVHGATWHPDGTRILSWGGDGTTRVWDLTTDSEIQRFEVNGNAWWSANGDKILMYDSLKFSSIVWDVITGETRYALPFPIVLTPDHAFILRITPEKWEVYAVETGERVHDLAIAQSSPVRWLSESNILVENPDDFQVWDIMAGQHLKTFYQKGHIADISGTNLLFLYQSDFIGMTVTKNLILHDLNTNISLTLYKTDRMLLDLKLSADASHIYMRGRFSDGIQYDELLVWEIAHRQTISRLAHDEAGSFFSKFVPAPDDNYILTTSGIIQDGNILIDEARTTLWHTATGEIVWSLNAPHTDAVWRSDGSQVMVYGKAGGRVWDIPSHKWILHFNDGDFVRAASWNPDETQIFALQENQIFVWDTP